MSYVGGGYGGGYYGAPDMYVFGGEYERGRDVHEYSHRGSVSRESAHPVAAPSAHTAAHSSAHSGGGSKGEKR